MRMVTKKIVTFALLALVLFCGTLDATSPKYSSRSPSLVERITESLSDVIQHPVQTVRDVKKFAAAPLSRWFGSYDEKEHSYGRMEDSSSWNMYPPHFDFLFSSEVDDRDPKHPKYHMDIDIDVEQPSYMEIVRQVTESLYEGGTKYVTQKVIVTEKIPPRGERHGRGIEEVYPSRVEEAPESEDTMRRFLRGEGFGHEKVPRHKEQARYGREEEEGEGWTDTLKQKGQEIKEDVKGAAKKVAEKAERPLKEMAEGVKEGVKEGIETAEEKLGDLGDKIKETGERAVEKGEEIRHGLKDTLKGVGQKIFGAEEKLRHGVEDKLEDIGDTFKDKATKLKDKTQDFAHKVEDKTKESIHNVENMVNQLQQSLENSARGIANMIYYPIHGFKQWLTGGVQSVGDFVSKESNAVKRTAHDVKNAIARQGEKIHIPPISEKLCDAGQSLLDTVCGGRQHGHYDKESNWMPGSERESFRPGSKYMDVPESEQEIRRSSQGGFVEEDEPYSRKHRHSEHVEEEVCRPVYSRSL